MSIFYGIACLLSLILLIIYFFINSKKQIWFMLLFISVLICNLGYFMLSLSQSLTFALISNSIAYIGNIFLPFFMLMLILEVCNIKHSKFLTYCLLIVGIIMLFIATSGGYLPIYYKTVSLEIVDGGSRLIKEYGVLHNLYYVYLFGYMLSMVAVIIYAIAKKKMISKMHAIFLCVIVFGNILVWFVEQFVEQHFEFLCISYIINEGLLLLLYGMLKEYEHITIQKDKIKDQEPVDISVLELNDNLTKEQIAFLLTHWQDLKPLTKREKEILKHILLGERRKEIAVNLFITESAVRKHTTNIFRKLEVDSRAQLYEKAKKLL